MKQKLGLVCALIHTPKVILLDEPTNGVDPVSRRDFWRILYSLVAEGVAILTSTSYLDEAERCHRVGLLNQGRMLFCDRPEELKKQFPGEIVAVHASSLQPCALALAEVAGVRSALLVGDRVHVFVDDAQAALPDLRARLESQADQVRLHASRGSQHRRLVCVRGRKRAGRLRGTKPS